MEKLLQGLLCSCRLIFLPFYDIIFITRMSSNCGRLFLFNAFSINFCYREILIMARVLQIRRGTTAQNDNFTGLTGEITYDTDAKTLRVHDGTTLGGFPLARADSVSGGGDDDDPNGGQFDISSVSPEFWQSLFAQYTPSPFTVLDSILMPIPTNSGNEYVFENDTPAKIAQVFLVCQTPEAGYSIGDMVSSFGFGDWASPMVNTYVDASGLHAYLMSNSQAFWVAHRLTGAKTNITNERWRMLFRVYC